MSYYSFLRPFIFLLPPELAHLIAVKMIKTGVYSYFTNIPTLQDSRLQQQLWGKNFVHPLGLAAGFDKNAECLQNMDKLGFGFAEFGTVTRYPQLGNPKPRLFRLRQDAALINRMGFNNAGMETILQNLRQARRVHLPHLPIGINIGINKNTQTPMDDYGYLLKRCSPYVDYVVVNVSSPNTPGLREMQKPQQLTELLQMLININTTPAMRQNTIKQQTPPPILLKIAPDLSDQELEEIAAIVLEHKLDGVIISNTTIRHKDFLNSKRRIEPGGLSGRPLFITSTVVLAKFFCLTKGQIPLIGVGGIEDGMGLYQKILAGASLCQIYTALIYHGPQLVNKILRELLTIFEQNQVKHISDIVGANSLEWARHELPEAYL